MGDTYSIEGVEALNAQGIIPVIPPPRTSVVHGKSTTTHHDKIAQYIKIKELSMPLIKNISTVFGLELKLNFLVLNDLLEAR